MRIPKHFHRTTGVDVSSNTLLKIEFMLCYQLGNKTPNTINNNNYKSLNSKMEGFHFSAATMNVTRIGLFGPR